MCSNSLPKTFIDRHFDELTDFTKKKFHFAKRKNLKEKNVQISSKCTLPKFTFLLISLDPQIVEKSYILRWKGLVLRSKMRYIRIL